MENAIHGLESAIHGWFVCSSLTTCSICSSLFPDFAGSSATATTAHAPAIAARPKTRATAAISFGFVKQLDLWRSFFVFELSRSRINFDSIVSVLQRRRDIGKNGKTMIKTATLSYSSSTYIFLEDFSLLSLSWRQIYAFAASFCCEELPNWAEGPLL